MKTRLYLVAIFIFGLLFVFDFVQASDTRPPLVKVYSQNTSVIFSNFFAFSQSFGGGGSVAAADLNRDGKSEIIVGAGAGGGPEVRVFSPRGRLLGGFFAFDKNFYGGVDVAVGDVDGDKKKEIVVSQKSNGQAWVKVYKVNTKTHPFSFAAVSSFLAYDSRFDGGVNIAVGNVTGKKEAEIVTASGLGSSGQIRVFNALGRDLGWQVFPFNLDHKGGADVAAGNVDGGKEKEIITSIFRFGEPRVKVYKTDSTKRVLGDFLAFDSGYREGVSVASGDLDSDKMAEVIASTNGGGPQVRVFEAFGKAMNVNFFPYENDFHGGVNVAAANIFKSGREKEIVTMPGRKTIEGRGDLYKYIEVDVSEQTLRAYLGGKKVNEFLVSTGTYKYPTPLGDFRIYWKLKSDRMRFEYGPDHPDNYDLPNVPNVLYFFEGYSLHGTYWHNNFGNRMSHGCVNLPLDQAAWMFDWANYGDMVLVRP